MTKKQGRVTECRVVLHRHHPTAGLQEDAIVVESLDELFTACLDSPSRDGLIDQLVLRGEDDAGQSRVITFSFAAMTADN